MRRNCHGRRHQTTSARPQGRCHRSELHVMMTLAGPGRASPRTHCASRQPTAPKDHLAMAASPRSASLSPETLLDSPGLDWDEVKTKADGPQGALPLTDEMLRHWPSRRPLRPDARTPAWAGTPAEVAPRSVPDPEHPGRPARRRRHADRPGLSHRPLGDRPAGAGGGRGAEAAGRGPVRRHGLRPLRRPDAGDGRA